MASVNSSVLLVLLIATQRHPRMQKWPVLLCQGCSIWIDMICEGGDPKMIAIPQIPEHEKLYEFSDSGPWKYAQVAQNRIFPISLKNETEFAITSKPSLVLNSAYIGNFEFRQCLSCSHLYRMHSIFTSIQITSFQHAGNSKNKGKWISHRLPETTISGNIKWCKVWNPHQPLKNFSRSLAKGTQRSPNCSLQSPKKSPTLKVQWFETPSWNPLDNLQKYITGLPNTYHQCENHQWGSAHRRWIRIALCSHNALVPQEFCLKPGVGHGFCAKYGKVASKSPWGLKTQWVMNLSKYVCNIIYKFMYLYLHVYMCVNVCVHTCNEDKE